MLDTSRFTSGNACNGTRRARFAKNNPAACGELLLLSDRYANVPLHAVYVVLAEPAGCTSISLEQHMASSWVR